MTEWAPATDAETAMRDALLAGDQERYFSVLGAMTLYLPTPAPAFGDRTPAGWATWNSGGRTHVLAFTSTEAMLACLPQHAGGARGIAYPDLASAWPNRDWWLAVNPGLPIEGYLPAWFVVQVAGGDARIPAAVGSRPRTITPIGRARVSGPPSAARRQQAPAVPAGDQYAARGGFGRRTSEAEIVGGRDDPGAVLLPPRRQAPAAPQVWRQEPVSPAPYQDMPDEQDEPDLRTVRQEPLDRPAPPPGRGEVVSGEITAAPRPRHGGSPGVAGRMWRRGQDPRPQDPRPQEPAGPGGDDADRFGGRRSAFGGDEVDRFGERRPAGADHDPATGSAAAEAVSRNGPAADPVNGRPAGPGAVAESATADQGPGSGAWAAGDSWDDLWSPTEAGGRDRGAGTGPDDADGRGIGSPAVPDPAEAGTAQGRALVPGALPPGTSLVTESLEPLVHSAEPATYRGGTAREAAPDRRDDRDQFRVSETDRALLRGPDDWGSWSPERTEASDQDVPSQAGPYRSATGDAWTATDAGPAPGGRERPSDTPWGRGRAAPTVTDDPDDEAAASGEPAETVGARATGWEPRASAQDDRAPATRPDDGDTAPAGGWQAGRSAESEASASGWRPGRSAEWEASAGGWEPDPAGQDAAQAGGWPAGDPSRLAWDGDRSVAAPPDDLPEWYDVRPATGGAPAVVAGEDDQPQQAGRATGSWPDEPAEAAPGRNGGAPAEGGAARTDGPPAARPDDFVPASETEASLLEAASAGRTDSFLSTLLLATVMLPVAPGAQAEARPGDPGFRWPQEPVDDQPFVTAFTSRERLVERLGEVAAVPVRFMRLIRHWPQESWTLTVNPATPIGAVLPGAQIRGLATWAAEVGLDGEDTGPVEPTPRSEADAGHEQPPPQSPVLMQKPVPPAQVPYYLDRGYDRVSGFVYRAAEVGHLSTPQRIVAALGLAHPGSPFSADDAELYVLRWAARCEGLYRLPYGGQTEAAMRAMEGWVIERAPFRGNGFAPSDSGDVIAEFKVDSVRLPHGAEMWRMSCDAEPELVATFDTDVTRWQRVGTS